MKVKLTELIPNRVEVFNDRVSCHILISATERKRKVAVTFFYEETRTIHSDEGSVVNVEFREGEEERFARRVAKAFSVLIKMNGGKADRFDE